MSAIYSITSTLAKSLTLTDGPLGTLTHDAED